MRVNLGVFAGTCRRQAFLFHCRQRSRGTDGSHHGDRGTPAEKGANLRDKKEEKASSGPVSQRTPFVVSAGFSVPCNRKLPCQAHTKRSSDLEPIWDLGRLLHWQEPDSGSLDSVIQIARLSIPASSLTSPPAVEFLPALMTVCMQERVYLPDLPLA